MGYQPNVPNGTARAKQIALKIYHQDATGGLNQYYCIILGNQNKL